MSHSKMISPNADPLPKISMHGHPIGCHAYGESSRQIRLPNQSTRTSLLRTQTFPLRVNTLQTFLHFVRIAEVDASQ